MNPQEKFPVRELNALLMMTATISEPQAFRAFFIGGVIANVVGNLPEEYWRRFISVEPCVQPGCNCHLLLVPEVIQALTILRMDHQQALLNMDIKKAGPIGPA